MENISGDNLNTDLGNEMSDSELGNWFYTEWLKEDLAEFMAIQIRHEIDGDIIKELIDIDKQIRFDDAMKGL